MKAFVASMFCLFAAACAGAGPSSSVATGPGSTPPSRILESGEACAPEAYAYSGVLVLADQLGDNADILQSSLIDLRQQLEDCLNDPEPDLQPVAKHQPARPASSY